MPRNDFLVYIEIYRKLQQLFIIYTNIVYARNEW